MFSDIMCQDVSGCVRMCQDVSGFVKKAKEVMKVSFYTYTSGCDTFELVVRMCQDVSGSVKMCQEGQESHEGIILYL